MVTALMLCQSLAGYVAYLSYNLPHVKGLAASESKAFEAH